MKNWMMFYYKGKQVGGYIITGYNGEYQTNRYLIANEVGCKVDELKTKIISL